MDGMGPEGRVGRRGDGKGEEGGKGREKGFSKSPPLKILDPPLRRRWV